MHQVTRNWPPYVSRLATNQIGFVTDNSIENRFAIADELEVKGRFVDAAEVYLSLVGDDQPKAIEKFWCMLTKSGVETIRHFCLVKNAQNCKGASLFLAMVYTREQGQNIDYDLMVTYLDKATEEGIQGLGKSWVETGNGFRNGLKVEESYSKKLVCSRFKSDLEKSTRNMEPDFSKALMCYKKALEYFGHEETGAVNRLVELGLSRNPRNGVTEDDQAALRCFYAAYLYGSMEARFQLGLMYLNGAGVEENPKVAFSYLKEAADKENTQAQYLVAGMYRHGHGVKQDYKAAFHYFSNSARNGSDVTDLKLIDIAREILEKENDDRKFVKVVVNFLKQRDSIDTLMFVGNLYEIGLGVRKNYAKALGCYFEILHRFNARFIEEKMLDICQHVIDEGRPKPELYQLVVDHIKKLAEVNPRAQSMFADLSEMV